MMRFFWLDLVSLFQKGGFAMWPLLFCLILGAVSEVHPDY